MQDILEKLNNMPQLTDEHIADASREQLVELLRSERKLRSSLLVDYRNSLTREMVLKDQIFEVEQKYCRLQTTIFNRRSEKSDSPSLKKKKKKNGDKKPADYTAKLPSERYPNVDIIEREVECVENPFCPCCGENMSPSEMFDISETLSIIPRCFLIVRQKRRKYRCAECKSGIVTTPAPPRIIPGSSYSDELIIDASISKYCDLMPMERYCRIAEMQGFEGLPANSLIETSQKLAEFFEPHYNKIRAETLANRVILADETTHRMLEGDKKKGWFLWGFSCELSCFFEHHDNRSGDVASAVLAKSLCEVLVSDVYAGYQKAVREANEQREIEGIDLRIKNAYCNSHARRGFKEASASKGDSADFMIVKYAAIHAIESNCKGKPASEVLSIRQEMIPFFEEMKNFAIEQLNQLSDKSSLAKAFNYFLKNYPQLTYFITDPETPISNNQSERLLRSPVIGRKTWYGTHSKAGAKTAGIHHTLVESCKLIGLNPRVYYRESVTRSHLSRPLLTPLEMKRELERETLQTLSQGATSH